MLLNSLVYGRIVLIGYMEQCQHHARSTVCGMDGNILQLIDWSKFRLSMHLLIDVKNIYSSNRYIARCNNNYFKKQTNPKMKNIFYYNFFFFRSFITAKCRQIIWYVSWSIIRHLTNVWKHFLIKTFFTNVLLGQH